jgi:glutaminase
MSTEHAATALAIVVQTKGLGAVVVRTFLSAYFMMSKSTMATHTFANIGEGLAWLQQLPGQNPLSGLSVSPADIEAFARAK